MRVFPSLTALLLSATSLPAQPDMAMEELIEDSLRQIREVNQELEAERERRWGAFRQAFPGAQLETVDFSELFPGAEASFLYYDESSARLVVHSVEQAREGLLPCSTFKIPHALIALETGVASGPEHFVEWDPERDPPQNWWPESWRRGHSLASAVEHSVVWYFQVMARAIGPDRMQGWLERLDYGNQSREGPIDAFWLEGGLRISAFEQLHFLRRLKEGKLPVSASAQSVVRQMIELAEKGNIVWSGKTGSGRSDQGQEIAWFVGWFERAEGEAGYFALNLVGDAVWDRWPPGERLQLVQQLIAAIEA